MSASLTDDRAESLRMIRDSAAAVVPADGDLGRVRRLRFTMPGFDPSVWAEMGELGWIGLRLPEDAGGIGLGMSEACALYEELGRALVPEPLLAGALSARLLAAVGEAEWLPLLLAGKKLVLTAWQEAPDTLDAPGNPDAPRCFLPMAAGADAFLLPLRQDGGLALYLLETGSAALETLQTQDGGHYGTLRPGIPAGRPLGGEAAGALALALDEAALGTAAYLLGVMERAFAMTLDYLRARHQFGKPLGSFQALQHRAADLKIQLALTRASVEDAAAKLDDGVAGGARQAVVSRAKARTAEAALRVTREAVQMHGAIGYTDEYDVGLYLRKAMVLANQFGSAAFHRASFMRHQTAAGD
ncbi:acyl-CoA dehydrogenase family protein [Roseomonas marmotae]|uniref:Acyl-CoA/acyl-ACP dehydrogenase n=1 Tax=Roseomonas marmotae TaxID=2768161 RepID=A0ABS3KHG2_9PROT|nr:acyl-CoA dehydrogenase family protein [Roseomonas marmotae]MBO1076857.1 acyl-CoA/acyl-ACP dehydrogenase [Roseomonas marmotae]QTI81193.1 acyl-CoA/acyl-ACP dehydrogenase [Roseomonas marmotae]